MTKIVHPYAHRLGGSGIRDWKSRWSSTSGDYVTFLKTDTFVREYLQKELAGKYVSDIEIERDDDNYKVIVKTSRSGMIIGRGGDGIEVIKKGMVAMLKKKSITLPKNIRIEVDDIKSPDSDAGVVAAQVVEGLEKRLPFRRVLKSTVEKAMANRDVLGIKVALAGRLGGAEMARKEYLIKGRLPLQTFRADIDYRHVEANLAYGVIGVKVWIYRGDIFDKKK